MSSARTLVDRLRKYKDEHNWDMAEAALNQSESILKRIEDGLTSGPTSMTQQPQVYQTSPAIDDTFWEHPNLLYPGFGWQAPPEELFPGVFSDLNADSVLFEPFAQMSNLQ